MKLTEAEIREMFAGDQIDVLVAKHVMGWVWPACKEQFPEIENWYYVGCSEDSNACAPEPGWSSSEDIAAAWEVVEKLNLVAIRCYSASRVYVVAFLRANTGLRVVVDEAQADTAPLAICRAGLLSALHAQGYFASAAGS